MASLFKHDGRYRVDFAWNGKRRSLRAGHYVAAAEAMKNRIEALVELAETKTQPAGDMRAWVESLQPKLRNKLAAWGLLDSLRAASSSPLADHVADYIAHCRGTGQDPQTVDKKERLLKNILAGVKAERIADLTADRVGPYLNDLTARKAAAATVNEYRKVGITFLSWCVERGRASSNPLTSLPMLDEAQDRRRVRRPLTDDELGRLLSVAEDRGRRAWYSLAVLAGLRRGDLCGIKWSDVDLERATLRIRATVGKSRREDVIPLHRDALAELVAIRPLGAADVVGAMRVFPQEVQPLTVRKDFLRAGLARKVYLTAKGVEVPEAEALLTIKAARKADKPHGLTIKIDSRDAEGRVLDLHSLRTTLGTNLARAGVAPQIAQRLMRHSSYSTTLKHYTLLGMVDMARTVDAMPGLNRTVEIVAATGTDDAAPNAPGKSAANSAALGQDKRGFAGVSGVRAGSGGGREKSPENAENHEKSRGFQQSALQDLNLRPLPCEGSALAGQVPAESTLSGYPGGECSTIRSTTPTALETNVLTDADLTRIVAVWPTLPAAVRAALVVIVQPYINGKKARRRKA